MKNPTKCINCGKGHSPKSNTCETWLKEKVIMRLKVTNNISYFEAKKMHENQPEITFSKIVQSIARPEMKDASTQYKTKDLKITTSTKVIESKVKVGRKVHIKKSIWVTKFSVQFNFSV